MHHKAAVKLTAEVVAETIRHMAQAAGVSVDVTLIAITTTPAGRASFDALLAVAADHVRQPSALAA
jgi:hypothetical protein